jgi:hypothetical protein
MRVAKVASKIAFGSRVENNEANTLPSRSAFQLFYIHLDRRIGWIYERGDDAKKSHHWNGRRLRARRKGPRDAHAAKKCNELTPPHPRPPPICAGAIRVSDVTQGAEAIAASH